MCSYITSKKKPVEIISELKNNITKYLPGAENVLKCD